MKCFEFITAAALTALLLVSCRKEDDLSFRMATDETRDVAVSVRPEMAAMASGTPETRAIDMPENGICPEIRTLCILQFDGTDPTARRVGLPHFLRTDADPSDAGRYLDWSRIRLKDSNGAKHTIVFLANTFSAPQDIVTVGDLQTAFRTIDKEADVFGHVGDGADFPNGETTYYQRISGIVVSEIAAGNVLSVVFHRSMARIRVHIDNTGADGMSVRDVRLCNVSQKDYFVTDYSYTDPDDGTAKTLFPEPFKDEYESLMPFRMDFDPRVWTGSPDGTGSAEYLWYVPSNMRGTDPVAQSPSQKNHCPIAQGATYLQILAEDADGESYAYRFYLGANLINDFNLCPNTSYTYHITLNGKGSVRSDERIETFGDIHFDVDANCYILNPLPDRARSFTFNAIHRPNIFWGARYGLNEDYPNYYIDLTKRWKAKLIMSDFQMTQAEANAFLSRREGDGSGDYMSDSQRIRITVPAGMQSGNITVGMYIDDPDNILWSWHLWITDYNPEEIDGHLPTPGEYIYPVTGGEVHRYAGASWQPGGRYEKGYIMDRHLGALDVLFTGDSRGSGMLYQYGRKDPFPGFHRTWYFDVEGNSISRTSYAGGDNYEYNNADRVNASSLTSRTGGANVPYTVNHPSVILLGGQWTSNDIFNPGPYYDPGIVWQDPCNAERTDHEELGGNADKSLFDPCPPGWRIPRRSGGATQDWAAGFVKGADETADDQTNFLNATEVLNGHFRGNGYTYYPRGYLQEKDQPDAPTVFFPLCRYRTYIGRFTWDSANYIYMWSDTAGWVHNGYYFSHNNPGSLEYASRDFHCTIRCVKL